MKSSPSSVPVSAVVPLPVAPVRIAGRLAHSGEELRIIQSVRDPGKPGNSPASAAPPSPPPPPAQNDIARLLEAVAEGLDELGAIRANALRELQQLAVRLGVHIARTILQHEFTLDSGRVIRIAEQAVAQLDDEVLPVVCVSPADLARLNSAEGHPDGPLKGARWRADPSLSPGDVRIEGGNYGLESRVGERLDAIAQHLLENLTDAATERRRAAGDGQPLGRFPDRRHSS